MRFANISLGKARKLFSLESYMQKYGDDQKRQECEEWKLIVFSGDTPWELFVQKIIGAKRNLASPIALTAQIAGYPSATSVILQCTTSVVRQYFRLRR